MALIDSHCHLDFPEFSGQVDGVLAEMADSGVVAALCVAVDIENFPGVLALAERHRNLLASVGVHPGHADAAEPTVATLVALAAHPRVVAIGETGLDYFRQAGDLLWQRQRFRTHIQAAVAAGKPLIVHTRAAADDTVRMLADEGAEAVGGVMHCFTEDRKTAEACLALGMHVSFSGILTFRNAEALREVAAIVPEDRLLIETDSPYLAPVPQRGKVNRPAFVAHVAEALARIRGVSTQRIAEVTTANFCRLFRTDGLLKVA
jgi:TatD DNase family protein